MTHSFKLVDWLNDHPGDDALLHGVETRTSAPVRVERVRESCEAVGLRRLFPAGEGAGYAGGIVSAAVDGLRVGRAVSEVLGASTAGERGGMGGEGAGGER
uniref:Amine oxidase domain-containing protein n=1 Tax=Haptolina brevifila TaxID=156173 RepID=A0A7S2CG41_9EUKA